jgi:hypothetical protein
VDDFKAIFDALNTGGVVGVGAILAYLGNWVRKLAPPFLALIHAKMARILSKTELAAVESQVVGAVRVVRAVYLKRHGPAELMDDAARAALFKTILSSLTLAFPDVGITALKRLADGKKDKVEP